MYTSVQKTVWEARGLESGAELALLLDMEKLMLAEMLLQDGAITMV